MDLNKLIELIAEQVAKEVIEASSHMSVAVCTRVWRLARIAQGCRLQLLSQV